MSRLLAFGRLLLGTLMLTAVAINFANVIGRYVFAWPIYWAEEAMVFLQVWCVFVAAALITEAGNHLRMEALESLAPAAVRRALALGAAALMALCSVTIAVVSSRMIVAMVENDQRSIVMQAPMALPYAALPVGFALIALVALRELWRLARRSSAGKQ